MKLFTFILSALLVTSFSFASGKKAKEHATKTAAATTTEETKECTGKTGADHEKCMKDHATHATDTTHTDEHK